MPVLCCKTTDTPCHVLWILLEALPCSPLHNLTLPLPSPGHHLAFAFYKEWTGSNLLEELPPAALLVASVFPTLLPSQRTSKQLLLGPSKAVFVTL